MHALCRLAVLLRPAGANIGLQVRPPLPVGDVAQREPEPLPLDAHDEQAEAGPGVEPAVQGAAARRRGVRAVGTPKLSRPTKLDPGHRSVEDHYQQRERGDQCESIPEHYDKHRIDDHPQQA